MAIPEDAMFNAPIPGQMMTAELGARAFQRPPQYATVDEAMDFYAKRIMSPKLRDGLLDVMEMGVPLTSLANSLQAGGVMQGKHTIDVGVLIMPVLIEMLAYVGDEEGIEYDMGMDDPEEDQDKFRDVHIYKAMEKVKEKMEKSGEEPVEEPMVEEQPPMAPAPEEQPKGLMARPSAAPMEEGM
jgi:hypothetical protein